MQKPKIPAPAQILLTLNTHRLFVAAKFTTIAVIVIAFYLQDLTLVFSNALTDEATFHILAIPFIFAYLIFRKRKMVNATLHKQESNGTFFAKNLTAIAGILLCASAILAYWYGSYTFTPLEYHMLTLPVLVAGLILVLFNSSTLRQLIFPIVFLLFLTPPPTELLYAVGGTLADLSAGASNGLANLFGLHSSLSSQYGSPIINLTRPNGSIMPFSVDVACSGVYSLLGFLIFAVFIAYITKGKLWHKLAILIMGIPLIIALNIIRITSILGIGYAYGDQLALQVFHAVGATVLMFIGTLILLGITEKTFKKPKAAQPCPTCSSTSPERSGDFCPDCGKLHHYPKIKLNKTDLAKIATLAIVVALLLTMQAPVFALTEGPAEVLIQTSSGMQPNTKILPLPQIQEYNASFVYRDTNFEQLSGQDASLVYAYRSTTESKPTVWVTFEIASTTGPLHRWEGCLVNYPLSQGNQPSVTQLDLRDTQIQDNPPIIARYFAFQYQSTNQTQSVLYWFTTSTFAVNDTSQQKQVMISLIAYPGSTREVASVEASLLPFAKAITEYWQSTQTWSAIALALSQNGLALSTATTTLLVALVFYKLFFIDRQEKLSLLTLYGKLPEETKHLVQAVNEASKEGRATTTNIAKHLGELTKTPATPDGIAEKLQQTEDSGLIEKKITNTDDAPAIVWKSNVNPKTTK